MSNAAEGSGQGRAAGEQQGLAERSRPARRALGTMKREIPI